MTGDETIATRRRWPLLLAALIVAATVGWALFRHPATKAAPGASSDPQLSAAAGPQTSQSPPGVISPTGAAVAVITTPAPTTTSSTRPPDPPATVAAQVAEKYLSSPPASRAEACKNPAGANVCTGDLAATLAAPGWVGGGGTAAPGPVTIVGTVASDVTATAIGYEIRATVAGRLAAMLVRVVRTADGHWLASTVQETS